MIKHILLIISLLLIISICESFTFTLRANKEECFYEDVLAGTPITVMFQVASGGYLDVDVYVCLIFEP